MRVTAFLLLALLALSATAAEVNFGPEYPLRPAKFPEFGEQLAPSVASNGRTYVAMWIDYRTAIPQLVTMRLDAAGNPVNRVANVLARGVTSAQIASVGITYFAVWKESSGSFFVRLDDDGAPIGFARALSSKAGSELVGLATNGSTYLVAYREARSLPVTISLFDGDGRLTVSKPVADLGSPLGIGADGRTFVYIDSACGINCARMVRITESGEITTSTVSGVGLPRSFVRAAFSPNRILLLSSASYVMVDYGGSIVASGPLPAKPSPVDAEWDGRQFVAFLVDGPTLSGVRITSSGSVADGSPFTISRTYAPDGGGLRVVSIASDGGSQLAVWSDTHFSIQTDVVARPFATFDDLAAEADTQKLVSLIDESNSTVATTQRDVQVAWGNHHLLAVWAQLNGFRTSVQASLDGSTQIEVSASTEIDVGGSSVLFPVVAAGKDSFLVVWWEVQDNVPRYLGRRVGLDGRLLDATPFQIGFDRLDRQPSARQWSLGHDGTNFVFVWSYGGIRGARITEDGSVLSPSPLIVFTYGDRDNYVQPGVARTTSGLFVGWLEVLPYIAAPPPTQTSLYGTRLVEGGTAVTETGTFSLSDDRVTSLAVAFAGDRITYAWMGQSASAARCVFVAQFTVTGDLLTVPRAIACGAPMSVDVAWNGSEHVVAWNEPTGLRALRVDRQGNPIDLVPFDVSPTPGAFGAPTITATPAGVTMGYLRSSGGSQVRAFAREMARLPPGPSRRRATGR